DDLLRARSDPVAHGAVDFRIPRARHRRGGARLQPPGRLAARRPRSPLPHGIVAGDRRLEREGMSYDVHALREREFPWAARGEAIYLNNASTGPVPARSLARINDFNERRTRPYTISDDDEMETIRKSRELAARLIGASPEEIGCMVNTTYGINVAARSLPLVEGDLVLSHG